MSGDVLVDSDRAAVGHCAPAHSQRASVLQLVDDVTWVGKKRFVYAICDVLCRIRRAATCGYPELQDLCERHSRFYGAGSKAIHRAVKFVGEHKSCVRSEHADAMRHVRKRRLQKHVGVLEALFRRLTL